MRDIKRRELVGKRLGQMQSGLREKFVAHIRRVRKSISRSPRPASRKIR